jgi:hypothetical protein
MSSTDNLPRPADSPCLKCASAGCTSITIGKGGPKEIFCVLCEFHAESVEAWNAEYKRKERA